jgi:hypothetical protein
MVFRPGTGSCRCGVFSAFVVSVRRSGTGVAKAREAYVWSFCIQPPYIASFSGMRLECHGFLE